MTYAVAFRRAANSTIHSSTITQLVYGTNCVIATLSVPDVGAAPSC